MGRVGRVRGAPDSSLLPASSLPLCQAQVLHYAARFAADWVCLEALTHCLYFNSIAKHRIGLRSGPEWGCGTGRRHFRSGLLAWFHQARSEWARRSSSKVQAERCWCATWK